MNASQSKQLQSGLINKKTVKINAQFKHILSKRRVKMPTGHCIDSIGNSAPGAARREPRLVVDNVILQEPVLSADYEKKIEEMKARAAAYVKHLKLVVPAPSDLSKRTRCVVCQLQRDNKHLMKSNKVIFCPFADPPEVGEKEMQRRKDHKQNQKKREKQEKD
jgi:hypothetical protein